MDCSPPVSSVHGISQMRILEWVAMSSSRGSSWPSDWTWVSNIAGGFFTDWAIRSIPFYEWGGGHGTCPEVSKLLSDFTPGVSCRACSIAQVGLNQALIPKTNVVIKSCLCRLNCHTNTMSLAQRQELVLGSFKNIDILSLSSAVLPRYISR